MDHSTGHRAKVVALLFGPTPNILRVTGSSSRRRAAPIAGRTILITGASSGIGRVASRKLAAEGARVILVARRAKELELVRDEIVEAGGQADYRGCDLTEGGEVDALVRWVHERHGGVDVLINNAGRSIRRPLVDSFDRLHDFERTMASNYFGPLRLTLGLLPDMVARGSGHVINVGTWTVAVETAPKFAAYHASKAALAAFGRCLEAELAPAGVTVTAVHFPLVRTPMMAPTADFADQPCLTQEQAAQWLVRAVRTKPVRLVPRYADVLRVVGTFSPRSVDRFLRSRT
ncbi:SDR family oxidoreductase [Nocardia asteroides]|uniref:SDR family oxidoreductase n=1 Tax=Nocardia asteroides TaxID=1824 RepID=UPI001E2E7381|nr:SDR family oxidoreductase [Nocardia asteroides]UGT62745.1 SDR family oxidoreductase [Nocardia asteroides]